MLLILPLHSDVAPPVEAKEAVKVADIEAYKVKDLWLELDMMSPVGIAGSFAVTVILYDGGEPVLTAGSATQAQSQFKVCKLTVLMQQKLRMWHTRVLFCMIMTSLFWPQAALRKHRTNLRYLG